jgi:hypothetical protein
MSFTLPLTGHTRVCCGYPELRLQAIRLAALLRHWASTLDDAHEYHDYRYDQQNVNQSAQGIGTDHSQQPKN